MAELEARLGEVRRMLAEAQRDRAKQREEIDALAAEKAVGQALRAELASRLQRSEEAEARAVAQLSALETGLSSTGAQVEFGV